MVKKAKCISKTMWYTSSTKLKGKIYKTAIRPAMPYVLGNYETTYPKNEPSRNGYAMGDNTLKDQIKNEIYWVS